MGEDRKVAELYLQIADQYQQEGLNVEAAAERRNVQRLLDNATDEGKAN